MKTIKKVVMAGVILLLSVSVFSACGNKVEKTESSSNVSQEIEVSISVQDGEDISEKIVNTTTNENLLTIMEENFDAKSDKGMITSIDGIEQDKNASKFWVFTINGEQMNAGAKECYLEDGDEVAFILEQF